MSNTHQLEVPVFRQAKHSKDCGLVCMQMVLAYYGLDISYEQLQTDLVVDEVGTYTPQMGKYFLDKGFRVEMTGLHPSLFLITEKSASEELVMARIKEKLANKDMTPRQLKTLKYYLDFLNAGGRLNVNIPDAGYIREALVQKVPLIASLTSNFLMQKPVFNFHFNVIKGIAGDKITVNDPLWDERGGEHTYNIDDYLYAIAASLYGDLDNGTLLKAWK